ncbi:ABC transporter ATP-binding protein [Bifidobacterium sp.]|uniref:ABC transporter ATP-binding protein n=1 Tax=Bifidobacterium sp. TaxID=41200 RepID=UPI003D7E2AA0
MGDDERTMLEGRDLAKWYGTGRHRRQVLFDVDVRLRAGECLAVIGGSGSGKTTLTRVLLGLERADGGIVEYCGKQLHGEVAHDLRAQSGLVFQNPYDSLDPRWRVGRSVGEPLRLRHPDWSQERIADRVAEALAMVSLEPETFAGRFPIDLSGGQAQRAAIARAIVDRPKVLLADEPMSAIDVAARVRILESFKAIRKAEPDMAIIMVSHDLGVVQHLADRILVLHDGHAVESGPTGRILAHPGDGYTKRLLQAATM